MGVEKRMGNESNTIILYSSQTDIVMNVIEREGVCYSKEEYIRRKYQESAPVFLTAYSWFVSQMPKYVPKPERAEFPYWAFADLYSVDQSDNILHLSVPKDEAVFFDVMDWNKIMRLSYIGENEAEEKAIFEDMAMRGLNWNDVMLTSFYPDWKKKIMESWNRLFRHHEAIKEGDCSGVHSVQAGLWQIKKNWTIL